MLQTIGTIFQWVCLISLSLYFFRAVDAWIDSLKKKSDLQDVQLIGINALLRVWSNHYLEVVQALTPKQTQSKFWAESFVEQGSSNGVAVRIEHGVGGVYAQIEIKEYCTDSLRTRLVILCRALEIYPSHRSVILSPESQVYLDNFVLACEQPIQELGEMSK